MAWRQAGQSTGATTSEYVVIAGTVVAIAVVGVGAFGRLGLIPGVERLGSCMAGAISGNLSACRGGGASASAAAPAATQPGCSSAGGLRCGGAAGAVGLEAATAANSPVAASVQSGAATVADPASEDPDGDAAPIIACAAQQAGIPADILWALYRAGGVPPDPDKAAAIARNLKAAHDRYGDWSSALAAHQAGSGAVDASGGRMPDAQTAAFVNRVLSYGRSPLPAAVNCK